MTKKELVEQRKALIAEIDGADEKRLAEIETELKRNALKIAELDAEERSKAADDAAAAEARAARPDPTATPENGGTDGNNKVVLFNTADDEKRETAAVVDAIELRTAKVAFGKQVRGQLLNTPVNLNAGEKRALGIALTTTSSTYTAPSADADGVNNGGVFIPKSVLYDLLETDAPDSPFLRDVKLQHIKGAVIFPYVIESSNGKTVSKGEGKDADDRSIKWGNLTLAQGNYPLTIEVTMELLAMTDEEFTDYLLADLANEMNLLLSDEVFYGTGKDNRIEGVTVGAIDGKTYAAGSEADAIKTGLLTLSRRARRGAKVYISRSMSLEMTFEKDKEGRYIFPIYNNGGISSIATVPVEVDESLHDGDFVIGNAKNYILNMTKNTEVYAELHGKKRVIEYTAHLMVAGKAAPKKFYYAKKAADSKGE
ncbi:MAG: phage major capsid protein [Clostridiales bacterium]|nr:phage major capsid protein [Clostridiales bacterium]MDE6200415.1 phage major capsid protein [Clostridiales bacterium]